MAKDSRRNRKADPPKTGRSYQETDWEPAKVGPVHDAPAAKVATVYDTPAEEVAARIITPAPPKVEPGYSEQFRSTHNIITFTDYIKNDDGRPGIIIRTNAHPSSLYSFVIRNEVKVRFKISERSEDEQRKPAIRGTSFMGLYEKPEVLENRTLQCELHTIEETLRAHSRNIEAYIGARVLKP